MSGERPICGAKAKSTGGFCKRPAGWGTDSKFGRCSWHGGASPSGKKYAAKLEAKAEAARLGAEVPLDPTEALTWAVSLVGGEVAWLRSKLAEAEEADDDDGVHGLLSVFASAVECLARVGKLAADAGIDERRLQLDALVIDRLGGAVTAAIEDASLDPEGRERLDAALRHRLGELSDEDLRPRPRELAV